MNKTSVMECDNRLAVDVKGLMAMLSCGQKTALKVGEKAGAVVRVGRRKLYNVEKVKDYLNRGSENE